MISLLALLAGFLLDLLIGDPHFLYHPVRLVGALISFLEKVIRKIFPKTEKGELAGGTLMAVLVMAVTTAVPALLLYFAGLWCVQARFVVEMILCYWLLATKSLKDESMKVYDKLAAGDLEGSRYAVSMIVGRDTAVLDEKGVTKAAVETGAENTSDGIIAPMLFMAIGGAAFGWFYKSINTMDSMVGYKNDKYLYFGRAAAKLARGRRVLDCFTHTGAFALNAAAAGAEHVTAVDVSAFALELAAENGKRNGLTNLDYKCADVFDLLTEMAKEKKCDYDYIILDPPAFTKSRATAKNAYHGYKEINRKAMRLLPRGGDLATCSCSHFMTDEMFRKMLREAALDAGVTLRQIEARQQAPDHPILPEVPETDYLKFYLLQVV